MINILTVKNMNNSCFKDLNVAFKENDFHLVTGSNKCGKTTFIKLLAGIIESEDTIFYKQRDISSLKSIEFSTLFGYFLYNGSFHFIFSNLDQEILHRLDYLDLSPSERKMKYKNLTQIFGLSEYLTNSISDLTIFQKIKASIMLELLHSPKILLLDQVFLELSEAQSKELISILRRIGGITVVATAQDLDLALEFDSLSIFNNGTLCVKNSPLDVLKEDSKLNKVGLSLPFMVDLSLKLKYYDLVDDVVLDIDRMVNELWK